MAEEEMEEGGNKEGDSEERSSSDESSSGGSSDESSGQQLVYEKPERPQDTKPAANVFELLDRILDKGLVIVGDIRISVADIELLKIQIRLLISSIDKAKEMGIDFSWAKGIEESKETEVLQKKIRELEEKLRGKG
jgi:hypothetical protein